MKKIGILLLTLLLLTINYNSFIENGAIVSFNQIATKDVEYTVRYTRGDEMVFGKYNAEKASAQQNQKQIKIKIPSKKVIRLKLDFSENPGTIILSDIKLNNKKLDLAKFNKNKDIEEMSLNGDQLIIKSNAENPAITYQEILNITKSRLIHYPVLIFLLILCFLVSCGLLRFMKGRQSKIDSIFIILFGILLFIPMGKISDSKVSVQENRRLAKYPTFFENNRLNEKFGSQFDTYFNDRFNGRDSFINIYNHIVSYINLKPYSRISLLGSNGWMFSRGHSATEMFQNSNLFSEKELQIVGKNLVDFEKAAKKKGVKNVYFLLNNDKESIYPEYYPSNIKKVGNVSRLEQVVSYLHKNHPELKVLNFKEKYDELKKSETVFYKTGTHMNNIGSFYNYKFAMEEIKKDYPDLSILTLDDFIITESDNIDQPGIDLDIYNGFKFLSSYPKENLYNKILTLKDPHAVQVGKNDYDHITVYLWENKHIKKKHSAFVLGDSFSGIDGNKYVETFSKFKRIAVGGGDNFNVFDSLEYEKQELFRDIPEIMIIESTERFLDRFLTIKFPED